MLVDGPQVLHPAGLEGDPARALDCAGPAGPKLGQHEGVAQFEALALRESIAPVDLLERRLRRKGLQIDQQLGRPQTFRHIARGGQRLQFRKPRRHRPRRIGRKARLVDPARRIRARGEARQLLFEKVEKLLRGDALETELRHVGAQERVPRRAPREFLQQASPPEPPPSRGKTEVQAQAPAPELISTEGYRLARSPMSTSPDRRNRSVI